MSYYYYPYSYPVTYREVVPVPNEQDQRFFPFLLPFVAGLAIGPLLFNRPYYAPYYAPYPAYPPAYPLSYPPAFPSYPYGGFSTFPQQYVQPTTENINIYTSKPNEVVPGTGP